MKAGWTWKIPMLTRFGSGYVYSSKFATEDEATADFCRLWNIDPDTTTFNQVRFRVGRNRRAWVKNCVSVGLSSCFVEPLESTGIYFTYAALFWLVKNFPDRTFDEVLTSRFNHEIETMFDETRDFLQAHFYCSPRVDTEFWKANKELELSAAIREKMAMYKAGLPINAPITDEGAYYGNFEAEFRNFWTNGSYYCIFAGLGWLPERGLPAIAHKPESRQAAEPLFEQVKQQQRDLVSTLPSNYELLCQIHGKDPAGG
jgi:tryptophan halogenase